MYRIYKFYNLEGMSKPFFLLMEERNRDYIRKTRGIILSLFVTFASPKFLVFLPMIQ